MAEYCTRLIELSPFRTASSRPARAGASLVNTMLRLDYGGERYPYELCHRQSSTKPMCDLLDAGLVRNIVDAQAFDLQGRLSPLRTIEHFEISLLPSTPIHEQGAVNKLDFVILGHGGGRGPQRQRGDRLDGIVRKLGEHPTRRPGRSVPLLWPRWSAGIPYLRQGGDGGMPGEAVDIVVTPDYGIAN